jgi:hypothetical protein
MPFPHNRATPLALCAAIGCLMYLAACSFDSSREPKPASAEQTTLDGLRNEPADPELDLLFDQLNTLHFSGRLPDVKVLWGEDLDRFDIGDYRLNGMTDGRIILIKPALLDDDAEVRRTLCHEMVHVELITAGHASTAHDAPFQNELRRVFEDGCFHAISATAEEHASLKAWIESERQRLDAARAQIDAQSTAIERGRRDVDRAFAELNERIRTANAAGSGWPSSDETAAVERHRAELNDNILTYNAAVAANERDLATYNEAVQRYNLMLAYPDGLAEDRAKGLIR